MQAVRTASEDQSFAGYGLGWLDAAGREEPNVNRMRVLAGLMAAGCAGRLTRSDPSTRAISPDW